MSTRKTRGVKCDRTKLDAALAASDLPKKTQIALAEAIADAEKTDSVPKDLVNRMFRGQAVDPQTVERVAAVLSVPAYQLYASGQKTDMPVTQLKQRSPDWRWLAVVLALLIIVVIGYWQYRTESQQQACYQSASMQPAVSSGQTFRVVIGRFAGDEGNQVQQRLASVLSEDKRLQQQLQVFTGCFSKQFDAAISFEQQIIQAHQAAQQQLRDYSADLLVWGERYGDRVSLRFTSGVGQYQQRRFTFLGRPVQVTENDFVMNIGLNDDSVFQGEFQSTVLSLMAPTDAAASALLQSLLSQYNYAGLWLKEAVISDSQLIARISRQSDPKLYQLTLTQLCYQRRLLGDIENSLNQYQQALEACVKARELIDPELQRMPWANLTSNMAVLNIRLQLYSRDNHQRVTRLTQAREQLESVRTTFDQYATDAEKATFYQNYAAVFVRLSQVEPIRGADYLKQALALGAQSLLVSDGQKAPLDHAQRLQNVCVMKYSLGRIENDPTYLQSALDDCQSARRMVDPSLHPKIAAMILNNLAVSYAILADILVSPELLKKALDHFEQAQQIYTPQRFIVNWAEVQLNKSELTCNLAILASNPDYLPEARALAESALEVFIAHKVGAYQTYTEGLLENIAGCQQEGITECQCGQ